MAKKLKKDLIPGMFKRGDVYWYRWTTAGKQCRKSLKTTDYEIAKKQIEAYSVMHAIEEVDEVSHSVTRAIKRAKEVVMIPIAQALTLYPITERANGTRLSNFGTKIVNAQARCFFNFAEAKGCKYITDISSETVKAYLTTKSAATRNRHLSAIRAWYRSTGFQSPAEGIKKAKESPKHKKSFTSEQVQQILEESQGELKTIFHILAYTGKRLESCIYIKWTDIIDGILEVLEVKTGKRSRFPAHPKLLDHLKTLDQSGEYILSDLTRSRQDRQLLDRLLLKELKRILKEEGFGAHSFRHHFAYSCARAGIPQSAIQDWLGHSSPTVTRIYTEHFSIEEKKKMLEHLKF